MMPHWDEGNTLLLHHLGGGSNDCEWLVRLLLLCSKVPSCRFLMTELVRSLFIFSSACVEIPNLTCGGRLDAYPTEALSISTYVIRGHHLRITAAASAPTVRLEEAHSLCVLYLLIFMDLFIYQ